MTENTYAHISMWVLAIILFIVALALHKAGKAKGFKITHMINRVLYIMIIITGGALMGSQFSYYWFKMVVGLIVITMMEMILVRTGKGKSTGIYWIIFVVAFLVILYLGLYMPQGFSPFN